MELFFPNYESQFTKHFNSSNEALLFLARVKLLYWVPAVKIIDVLMLAV